MKRIGLVLFTPIFILLSHYLAVFPHEYAHSFAAWMLGYKNNPLDLDYGGAGIMNMILLINIDQKINSPLIYQLTHPTQISIISLAGPVMSMLLYLVSLWLLNKERIRSYSYLFCFLLFFNLMNLGYLYDYVPFRTFTQQNNIIDLLNIAQGLNISPWWIYIIGGYIVAFMIWHFFSKTLITAYIYLHISNELLRGCLLSICVAILFGYYALPGLLSNEAIPFFLSATSILAIPGLIIALWPTKKWVDHKAGDRGGKVIIIY